ncbi:MAG: HAD family hydrolase [Acidocella sp. 20-57-95]|nr:MAG: HAD family hydrolase [Acidocella sp. 20-57-95]OYV61948.1 MAG: HAD family hydrolase [Acidocella sp. 21-58-7]HQT63406.1 HAD family phosphatase [Acidocella sp.]HQU04028.1 HAD family phosphatase [Acidocella sp.]
MIKAVIFDMDGVLIEAKDWHYEALNRALRLFGYEISRYDHLTTFDGLPTKKKLQMLSAVYDLPVALHDFINELKQLYTMEIIFAQCKPRFNHEYALSRLRAEGLRLAVCSNSVRDTIDVMMEKAALKDYLEFTVSNQDVTKPKPDPEMYAVAIQKMGLMPAECLVVEDHENGIRAAKAAGAHILAVRETTDVTYGNIMKRIHEIAQGDLA